ncbi:MAG: cation:proton antiporter [Thermodesulfovibrionales bacterium]|nr:cation:proton antiporter [Thermodesulfovibrionales bacterium]
MASLWIGLALIAALLSAWLRIATALSEIMVGTLAQLLVTGALGLSLNANEPWIKFLAGAGAIILTFLAGAEIDPDVFRVKWKEATVIGLVAFFAPFLGCTAFAYYLLGWTVKASWLTGVALSTTSVAVVYAVMLELGLNKTEFGKVILAACFINDLGTVLALGLIFSPFTVKTAVFVIVSLTVFILLPHITPRFFHRFGGRPSEIEAKYLLLVLFGLGAIAVWSESEAVLPAYIIGMILAGTVGRDHGLIRRLRTMTFGLLTPFYFIRAGSFVSIASIMAAPLMLLILFMSKMITKFLGVYPITKAFRYAQKEGMFTTLLMSTGLTFGSISALFGFTHGIIDQQQYSLLIAAIIGSAVIPTLIANTFFIPHYLLPKKREE